MLNHNKKYFEPAFAASERRLVFDTPKEAPEKKYEKQEAIDIVKKESDKRVDMVMTKLDQVGGNFKSDLYGKLYEYYQSSAERAAKDGKLDAKAFAKYKEDTLKKTDDILKQYLPSQEEIDAKKNLPQAAKEAPGENANLKLGEIPKEIPEDTPVENVQEKLKDYGTLSSAFNKETETKLNDIQGFFKKIDAVEKAKEGFTNRVGHIWDRAQFWHDTDYDKAVAGLKLQLEDLKSSVNIKKAELATKKDQLEKYGKSIGRALDKKKTDLMKARDEEVKKVEDEKKKQGKDIVDKEKKYKDLKVQEKALLEKREQLSKSKDNLEKLKNEDDSPQRMTAKLQEKQTGVDMAFQAESQKEKFLKSLLEDPELDDEQRKHIEAALAEVNGRKQKATDGKSYLAKGLQKSKGAQVTMTEAEKALEGDLSTVDTTLTTFVDPTMQSIDESLILMKSYKEKYANCAEGVKDKYAEGIDSVDKIHEQVDNFLLDTTLSNSLSLQVLNKGSERLDQVKVVKDGIFGAVWDGVKGAYQGTIGWPLGHLADGISAIGKWINDRGNYLSDSAKTIEGGWKYPAAVGAEVVSFVSGAIGGLVELGGGLVKVAARPFDVIEGVASLLTINAKTGEIGDKALAGTAWKELGKALISYEDFSKGHIGTGIGKIGANIAAIFFTGGAASAGKVASVASKLARAEKLLAAGEKAGMFTGRIAEASTFFRVLGKEAITFRGAGNFTKAANVAKASEGSLSALRAVEGAGTTAKMAERGAAAVKAAETAEEAALAAKNLKLVAAEDMAKMAKDYALKATNPNRTARAEKMAELATKAAKEAEEASHAADLAMKATEKVRIATKAMEDAASAEKVMEGADAASKAAKTAEATTRAEQAAKALEEALKAADEAQGAANVLGRTSPILALTRSFLQKLPGGKEAAMRYGVAEGARAKVLAVARGVLGVAGSMAVEGVKLTYQGAKLLMWELPIGILRGSIRILRALPQLGKLAAREALLGKGAVGLAFDFNRVGRALNIMEKEGSQIGKLREVFEGQVIGKAEVVEDILNGIRADKAFGSRFNDVKWDEVTALIKEDPSLTALSHANPELHKLFETRALGKLREIDRLSAESLVRIQEAGETIFQWSAKDERVARILDQMFDKGLYPKGAKGGMVKAAKAAEATPVAVDAAAVAGAATTGEVKFLETVGKDHHYLYKGKEIVLTEDEIAARAAEFARTSPGASSKADWDGAVKALADERVAPAVVPVKAADVAAPATTAAEVGKPVEAAAGAVGKSAPYRIGRYMRGRMDQARGLFERNKVAPTKTLKARLTKILKEQSVLVVNILKVQQKLNQSVEERMQQIDNAITQIEGMGNLPPDIVLPEDVQAMLNPPKESTTGGETSSTVADIPKEKWDQAPFVDGRFKNADLVVSANVPKAIPRDDAGKTVGDIPGGTPVTVVDVSAKARQVDDTTYVKVKYTDNPETKHTTDAWVDESQLEQVSATPSAKPGTPETAGAGKTAGEDKVEGKPESSGDRYKDDWEKATMVDGRFNDANLLVSSRIEGGAISRDDTGTIVGNVPSGKEVVIMDVKAKGRQIGDQISGIVFIKVRYMDGETAKDVWVDESQLELANAPKSPKVEVTPGQADVPVLSPRPDLNAPLPPGPYYFDYVDGSHGEVLPEGGMPPEAANTVANAPVLRPRPDLPTLVAGPLYISYMEVMNNVAEHKNSPDGVTFTLKFNGNDVACRLLPEEGMYVLHFTGGEKRYRALTDFMMDLNSGNLHRTWMDSMLMDEKAYKPYKEKIGGVDTLEPRKGRGDLHLELDWKGRDPDIYIHALPHGRIAYQVNRKNVGIYGADIRSGTSENFDDFMKQMEHIRQWTEAPEHVKGETPETSREVSWTTISNPYSFVYQEKSIGRSLDFKVLDSGAVQLHLDWGGGNDAGHPANATLNVWTENDGSLRFTVSVHGVVAEPENATNFTDLIRKVEVYHERATGAVS